MRSVPHRLELVYAGLVLFLLTGAVFVLAAQGVASFDINSVAREDRSLQTTFLGVYALMFLLLAPHLRGFVDVAVRDPALVALLVFMMVSASWSADPGLTLRRSLGVLLTSIFGFYLATRFPSRTVLRLLVVVLGSTMVLSALTLLLLPAYGDSDLGWRGVYLFKNQLGRAASLTVLLVWILMGDPLSSARQRRCLGALGLLSVVLLVGSQARSALVVTVVCGTVLLLLPRADRLRGLRSGSVCLVGAAVVGVYLAGFRVSDLFDLLGKDEDLTGRTPLWGRVWEAIQQHPFIGYGYSGFWGGADAPSAVIWEFIAWRPTHAHNGLLEFWLDLGLIGLLLLAAVLIRAAVRGLVALDRSEHPMSVFTVVLPIFLLLSAVSESVFMRSNIIFTTILVYVAVWRADAEPLRPRAPLISETTTTGRNKE